MIRLFHQYQPGWLLFFGLLLFFVSWMAGWQIDQERWRDLLFYPFIEHHRFEGLPLVFIYLFNASLITFQAFLFNHWFNKYRHFQRQTYFPAAVYIWLALSITPWANLSPVLIANTFLLGMIDRLFALYKHPMALSIAFNAGLWGGFAWLACPMMAPFLLPAGAIFALMRPFQVREWLIFFIGISTPFYLWISYFYLTDSQTFIAPWIDHSLKYLPWNQASESVNFYPLLLPSFFGFIGWFFIQQVYFKSPILIRYQMLSFFWLLLTAIISIILWPDEWIFPGWAKLQIPLAFAIVHYFIHFKWANFAELQWLTWSIWIGVQLYLYTSS